ncbi:hypothetical protein MBLNU459_g2943t1 [Dothideomycetes sp. NU459]
MKTRATRKTPAKATDCQESATPGNTLEPSSTNPPMLFILPDSTSTEARIVTLQNPATSTNARYYACPDRGIYEFTKIAAPKKTPRSWLLAPPMTEEDINGRENVSNDTADALEPAAESLAQFTDISKGYAIENADLFVATPVDPLFMILPALTPKSQDTHKQLFLSIDDHLDALTENSKHMKHLLRADAFRTSFEKRADAICDNVEIGDEKMYRLSNEKLLAELARKAQRMTANGLPASLEEKFVQEALHVPVTHLQREESSMSAMTEPQPAASAEPTPNNTQDSAATSADASFESQDSATSVLTEATSVTITEPNPTTNSSSAPPEILSLLRQRTALHFILHSYISPVLRTQLLSLLCAASSPIDFSPLDAHLAHIATLKRDAQALRSLSDNISRKRGGGGGGFMDDEAEEARAEKKRKKDEDEARKKNQSRGVKQLAKVNTAGMQKLSSFFTKKAPVAKKA